MIQWYYRKWPVLLALLLLGPLAFPLLWKSAEYTRFWKIFLTAVFAFLTVYFLVLTVITYKAVWNEMKKAGLI
jgi:hypothetical protein